MTRKQSHQYEVEKYQAEVLDGKRPAGRREIAAIERHLSDLETGLDRGLYFSWDHANVALDWFPLLRHPLGGHVGQPFNLVAGQKSFLSIAFGWRQADTGLRRFREILYSVARGNGKSPTAAAIALLLFAGDAPMTPGAEVACLATTEAQARDYVWSQVRDFARSLPSLGNRLRMLSKTIEFELGTSVGKCYPRGVNSTNLDGGNLHACVIDELHNMTENHRKGMQKLKTSMGKRLQDLLIYITTAGSDASPLWLAEYDYSNKIDLGIVSDDRYLSYIFEADEDDDFFGELAWLKANPLFEFLDRGRFKQMAERAKHDVTSYAELLRYKCNRMTSSRLKAFQPEVWALGSMDVPDLAGRVCFGGLDLGWRDDIAAFTLCFPVEIKGRIVYCFESHAWIPRDGARDLRSEPFASLIQAGLLNITDGNTTDIDAIERRILECRKRYDLKTIAADPNNARGILTRLHNQHGIEVYEFFQTCRRYNEPVKTLLTALDEFRVRHGGNALLKWCADNVILRSDSAGLVMPAKDKSIDKIDPIVALLMALSEALFSEHNQPAAKPNIRSF